MTIDHGRPHISAANTDETLDPNLGAGGGHGLGTGLYNINSVQRRVVSSVCELDWRDSHEVLLGPSGRSDRDRRDIGARFALATTRRSRGDNLSSLIRM